MGLHGGPRVYFGQPEVPYVSFISIYMGWKHDHPKCHQMCIEWISNMNEDKMTMKELIDYRESTNRIFDLLLHTGNHRSHHCTICGDTITHKCDLSPCCGGTITRRNHGLHELKNRLEHIRKRISMLERERTNPVVNADINGIGGFDSMGGEITIIFNDYPNQLYGFDSSRHARKWLRRVGMSSTEVYHDVEMNVWYGQVTPEILLPLITEWSGDDVNVDGLDDEMDEEDDE